MLRLSLITLILVPAVTMAESKRPMTVADLLRFDRVSDPQISPDGRHVVYVVGRVDLEGNRIVQHLWLAATDGSTPPRQLTTAEAKDSHPRWDPSGRRILFHSDRSGTPQLWLLDLAGGEARRITDVATGASQGIWSPDGKRIACVSAVFPEYSTKPFAESNRLSKQRIEEKEKNPVKARVFTKLFFRHWDSYVEGKRQHLLVLEAPPLDWNGDFIEPRDVTPGDRDAVPTSSTFSVGDDFTFTPDSRHLIFTATPKENEAWSTNFDLCRVSVDNASTEWECLTSSNAAADGAPIFSPDGTHLAYRAQKQPGFEADKWDLLVVKTDPSGRFLSAPVVRTRNFDRSPESIVWCGSDLIVTADEHGTSPIYLLADEPRKLIEGNVNGSLSISRDGTRLAFSRAAMHHPAEVFVASVEQPTPQNVSHANDALLRQLDLPRPESVYVDVEGARMQMWILKPPGFDPNRKWPLVYLVHGGPQGAWSDSWSFRWNPEVWAAQGYVIALPNPRGSTGFGQKFVNEISGDWGGKCFDDLMKGLAYLEKQPYIDTDRLAAAGASFGGYMMNWFLGHTTKFKTIINHCGVFNHESMYATTEELWFDEWEHGGGKPLWEAREKYLKHSPHLRARYFKTPTLIIHNDLDFRVPVSEGLQLFTTLQRLGVPSKMINFPDEGHWVLKPKNSEFWHREVFAWLKKYVAPGGR